MGYQQTSPMAYSPKDDEPILIGDTDFDLTDQHGKKRKRQEFLGRFQIVYFGYAHCPEICPMALQHISQALKQLGADRGRFAPIFITLDPKRDTSEVLFNHAKNFDPSFVMLTGPEEELKSLQSSYQVYAKKKVDTNQTDEVYDIDHSSLIYLMSPEGKFLQMFPHTTKPERIAQIFIQHLLG